MVAEDEDLPQRRNGSVAEAAGQLSRYSCLKMLHKIRAGRVVLCMDNMAKKEVVVKQYWTSSLSDAHLSEASAAPIGNRSLNFSPPTQLRAAEYLLAPQQTHPTRCSDPKS